MSIVDGGQRRRRPLQPAEASRVLLECLRMTSRVMRYACGVLALSGVLPLTAHDLHGHRGPTYEVRDRQEIIDHPQSGGPEEAPSKGALT